MNTSFGYIYENVPLGSGSVLQDIFLDESTEQITLATSSDQGSQVGYASAKLVLDKLVGVRLGFFVSFSTHTCTLLSPKKAGLLRP